MKNELEFKAELEQALSKLEIPKSLYQFAKEVPDLVEMEGKGLADRGKKKGRGRRIVSFLSKCTAAVAILAGAFTVGVSVSPVFANYMKEVPGIEVAVDWLTRLRERDGVQVAVKHGYTPIKEVTAQFGGTTITISDIYLTDEELLYKAFIRTDEFDVTDGRSPIHLSIYPRNLLGGGSTTASSIAETVQVDQRPIKQESYKFQLHADEAQRFLASGQALELEVMKRVTNNELRKSDFEKLGTIQIQIDSEKLLHNKVLEPNQIIPIELEDPDWDKFTLEKLTIQPTTMNAIISGKPGWTLDFPRDEGEAPYIKDEKGHIYRYDPSGPVLMLEDGHIQLPFSSSVFFDKDARSLQLHIGTVNVTEKEPSGSFELSTRDTFPKTVMFKDKQIVIEGAVFEDGYIRLKIRKEYPGQRTYTSAIFRIMDYPIAHNEEQMRSIDSLRKELNIDGWEMAKSYGSDRSYLEAYIPAPKQDHYTISLQRVSDPIVINRDYPIVIK